MSSHERSKILLDVADALEASEKLIIAENEADVAAAQQAGYEKSLVSRLTLTPSKVRHSHQTIDGPSGETFLQTMGLIIQSLPLKSSHLL